MRAFALLAALMLTLAMPAGSEVPNLSLAPETEPGAAAQLVLAQSAYLTALRTGDPVLLVTAIRLAREISLRPPAGWTRTGESAPDQPEGATVAPDPAGAEALAIAQRLAGENPDLQDLVYDLDAQLPHGRRPTAVNAPSSLDAGQSESWRMVLAGQTAAEIGLIGDGNSALALTIRDEGGALVCARPPTRDPALCRFTPARNGFFSVEIRNADTVRVGYRLVAS